MIQGWEAAEWDDPALLQLLAESMCWDWEGYLERYWPVSPTPQTISTPLLIEDRLISCHLGTLRVDASSWVLLLFADRLLNSGAPGPAIIVLEQIRPVAAQTPLTLIHLGIAYKDLAEMAPTAQLMQAAAARAIAFFQQCLALDFRWAVVYRQLGDIYQRLGDRLRAETCWRQYLELEPTNAFSDKVRAQLAALAPASDVVSPNGETSM